MTEETAQDLTPPTAKGGKKVKANGEAKAPKEPKPPKEKKETSRTKLAKQYPEDASLTVLVDGNPKKAGSAAAAIFEFYRGSKTVGDFFAATLNFEFNGKKRPGTYADITYDVGHGYIKVG
jgi:hypothetical protein